MKCEYNFFFSILSNRAGIRATREITFHRLERRNRELVAATKPALVVTAIAKWLVKEYYVLTH